MTLSAFFSVINFVFFCAIIVKLLIKFDTAAGEDSSTDTDSGDDIDKMTYYNKIVDVMNCDTKLYVVRSPKFITTLN